VSSLIRAFLSASNKLSVSQELFVVLTDTFHKAAFKLHATMLMSMIDAVESGQVYAFSYSQLLTVVGR
jgi:hypothetical protein